MYFHSSSGTLKTGFWCFVCGTLEVRLYRVYEHVLAAQLAAEMQVLDLAGKGFLERKVLMNKNTERFSTDLRV